MGNIKHVSIGLYVMMVLSFSLSVSAFTCSYDSEPYLTDDIDWSCTGITDAECYAVVFDMNGNALTVSPPVEDIDLVGRIDYFASHGSLVNVKFRTTDLYDSVAYNFTVFCSSNSTHVSYGAIVVPHYSELRAVPYRGIWIKENMPYLFAFIIIVLFAVPIIYLFKKR